jgi:hypothetical protein
MKEYYVATVTLTVDTGTAYASGDLLADTQEITNFFEHGKPAKVVGITVLDVDDQAGAFDLVFVKQNTSLGTENSAFSPSDAVAADILQYIEIVAGDYEDFTNSQWAHLSADEGDTGFGHILYPEDNTSDSVYVAAISKDTKTYTTAGALQLKISVERDA